MRAVLCTYYYILVASLLGEVNLAFGVFPKEVDEALLRKNMMESSRE